MAINFNELPNGSPTVLVEPGRYFAVIETAEMKQGKDPAKPPYLNMKLGLTDKGGKSKGKIFDIITESTHENVLYKLKRFILALNLPIAGEFDLKDLPKIVQGKKLIVDVTHDKEGKKAIVDIFTNDIYYPVAEASELFEGWVMTEDSEVIEAPDADDVIAQETDVEY